MRRQRAEHDAAGDLVDDLVAEEVAHDLEAELQGGAGAAAGDDELVDDDRVLVDDRTALGDGLDERGVRGRVAAIEDAQLGQDRGAAQIAAMGWAASERRSTSAWMAGVAFRPRVPACRLAGRGGCRRTGPRPRA